VPLIQKTVDLPLCIDSGRPQPIEAALNLHRGKAMINSVNGDPAKMGEIFPLAKKYGSKVIALTSSREGGIPATSEERLKIAQTIATEAQKYGVPLGDIYFDPLVMALSTQHGNGTLFLETLRGIKKNLGEAKTVSGLSNISFGLPKRRLINQVFLVLALGCGMDAAILDPTDKALMAMIRAGETLMGKDPFCAKYISAFREGRLDV